MKYVIVLGDGMADWPIEALDGRTPLEYASTPMMDELSKVSEIGLLHTIPEGMKPGSDTANLSVLGYDARKYYTGRSPLEEQMIIDHSSGEISTEDAAVLLNAVKEELQNETYQFYVGTSYRHLLIWDQGEVVDLVQPHDVLGQKIGPNLPKDDALRRMMIRSYEILKDHPLNQARKAAGKNPANCFWFWGAGTRPSLSSFEEKTGLKGSMISAVDLLKGIAVGAGMKNITVEGANGTLETNYEGKAQAAIDTLVKDGQDFVYVHVEAPDEMGHQGSIERKVKSIEYLDSRVIRPIKEGLDAAGVDYRMMVLPDHPTPIKVRTHTSDPVPYMLYDSTAPESHTWNYNEKEAKASGNYIAQGHEGLDHLLGRKTC